jgi:hypothetical protein
MAEEEKAPGHQAQVPSQFSLLRVPLVLGFQPARRGTEGAVFGIGSGNEPPCRVPSKMQTFAKAPKSPGFREKSVAGSFEGSA